MFKIALICGGPSSERGISLNSARSLLDHLSCDAIEILPLYVDLNKNFYAISTAQLYSNTPGDFDFKLSANALNEEEVVQFLQEVDLVFPVIHGAFGEDGELQEMLERFNIPFVGSGSASCRKMYDKRAAKKVLEESGYPVLPTLVLPSASLDQFFKEHKKAVVKPTCGGSSIGVSVVTSPSLALEKSRHLPHALLEAYCEGKEFTVVVFEAGSLIPTEIEMDYGNNQIFDYRRKYLASNQVAYRTPPSFKEEVVKEIRRQAEQLFHLFQMRDFVRIDGWVMPDGTLYFSDINPISGLEQNSFLFRQASVLGLTHAEALLIPIKSACRRYGLRCPVLPQKSGQDLSPVYVLFGGGSAERQVSLMSGTNVWLKLLRSTHFHPTPFFYDLEGDVWELPYSYTLDHSVEEIYHNCKAIQKKCPLINEIQRLLEVEEKPTPFPTHHTLEQFLERARREHAFVFIAMHGGVGENGTLQALLEQHEIPHNGSDSVASALCMDKYLAGEAIANLRHPDIISLPKKTLKEFEPGERMIVKPRSDGCSAGIVLLHSKHDAERYLSIIEQGVAMIPPHTFANQREAVEMPAAGEFILEPYIETDAIHIRGSQLIHTPKEGWIELTVGVLEEQGVYHAFSPSISIAEGAVLSLEEKFQGGTGVNLTPPPEEILPLAAASKIKRLIEKIAEALNIRNYARIDIFFNRISEKLIFIEANSLPGLTPSTVFYHQGLAEEPPLAPIALLEKIIKKTVEQQNAIH